MLIDLRFFVLMTVFMFMVVVVMVMIKVTSDPMVFFTMFHMHIEVCSPNTAFRDAVYMKMVTVERNGLNGFF